MPTLKELRDKKAKLVTDAEAIRSAHPNGTRMPKDKFDEANRMLDEVGEVDLEIEQMESEASFDDRLKRASDALKESRGRKTDTGQPSGEPGNGRDDADAEDERRSAESKAFEKRYARAFRGYLRFGNPTTPETQEILNRNFRKADKEVRSRLELEYRDFSTTPGASGGFLIAPQYQPGIKSAMLLFQGVAQAGAENIVSDFGTDLPFQTNDDTTNEAIEVAENAAHGNAITADSAQKVIKTFTYTTGTMKASLQMLRDASFPLEAYIFAKFAERMGRGTNTRWTLGNGTTQPEGIVTAINAIAGAKVITAANNAFTADEWLDLKYAVDPAYRVNGKFAMHDLMWKRVRLLKDAAGNYIVSRYGEAAKPNIDGSEVVVFTKMASAPASNAVIGLFGDFSHYKTRTVNDAAVIRISEKYVEQGQVGFLMFQSFGGGYVNPGNNPIKALVNAA